MSHHRSPAEVARAWFQEVWIQRDPSAIARLMAPDAKGFLEPDQTIVGPAAFEPMFHGLTGAFPDLEVIIEDIVADDSKACVRWSASGTHQGATLGLAPTGKPVRFRGMTWMTVKEGLIREGWDSWNQGQFLANLQAG